MVEEWVMGKSERVGARTRRCKRDGQRGKGGVEEEERKGSEGVKEKVTW